MFLFFPEIPKNDVKNAPSKAEIKSELLQAISTLITTNLNLFG